MFCNKIRAYQPIGDIENTFHSIYPNIGRSRILKPFSYAIKHSRFFSLYLKASFHMGVSLIRQRTLSCFTLGKAGSHKPPLMLGLTPLGYGPQGYNLQIMGALRTKPSPIIYYSLL
jgi:hypothetical protein